MSQTKAVGKIKKTHFVFRNSFFFENHSVCDIMGKNVVERVRPHDNLTLAHCTLDA